MAKAAKSKPELGSATQVAAAVGATANAVRKRVSTGKLTPPNREGLFDLARAVQEWKDTTRPGEKRGRKGGSPLLSALADATDGEKTGKEANPEYRFRLARARREEYHVRKLNRELVDARESDQRVFELARAERDAWLNWPTQIASVLAAKHHVTDTLGFLSDLEAAVREQLASLAAFMPPEPA